MSAAPNPADALLGPQEARIVSSAPACLCNPVGALASEGLSPELVLVDVALAVVARERLPATEETLVRISSQAPSGPARAITRARSEHKPRLHREPLLQAPQRGRTLWIATAACAGLLAFVAAGGVDGGGSSRDLSSISAQTAPEPRDRTKPDIGSTSEPQPTTKRAVPFGLDSIRARRFAWAPAVGATGYHVEFFRGRRLVYRTHTEQAAVVIPPSWKLRRKVHRLSPGVYRWYVWAEAKGVRLTPAIVQTTLVVPPT